MYVICGGGYLQRAGVANSEACSAVGCRYVGKEEDTCMSYAEEDTCSAVGCRYVGKELIVCKVDTLATH
jgi:hypothetical protein